VAPAGAPRRAAAASAGVKPIESRASRASAPAEPAAPAGPTVNLDALLMAVETFDTLTLETELGRAALLLRPPELLSSVLLPLLARVGDDWHAGRGTVAQEHFLSTCVRSVLGTLLRAQMPRDHGKRLLFATPSGELHELGTLGAALLAAANGLGVLYLGADLPCDDLASSAAVSGVDVVVLGVTGASPTNGIAAIVAEAAQKLPAAVELWVGGPAAKRVAGHLGTRVTCVSSYDEFQSYMERLTLQG